jgi:hypothetical protein
MIEKIPVVLQDFDLDRGPVGFATLNENGEIVVHIRESDRTRGLYEIARAGGLRSFSFGYSFVVPRHSEEDR